MTMTGVNPVADPSQQVRVVHLSLQQLGLRSPLGKAVAMLERQAEVDLARQHGAIAARVARAALAQQVANGERAFDEDVLREWARTSLWVHRTVVDDPLHPAAAELSEAVGRTVRARAVELMNGAAGSVFDTVAEAARSEVAQIEALPEAPRALWGSADPTRLLASAPEHENSLSTLLRCDDRFWRLQRIADVVRDPAGFGFNRLPDGAPRLACVYRNWRAAMEGQDDHLRPVVHRNLRLWHAVTADWQPGVWRPEDVAAPTKAERSFGSRLARLGSAVG